MPVQKVKKNGKTCYRWGDKGKIYCGPGAKEKAKKQGRAIEANKSKMSRADELIGAIAEILSEQISSRSK